MLGRDDLFPYTIEFRRHIAAAEQGGGAEPISLMRMQLFEVRTGVPIDSRQFGYKPGGKQVDDRTDQFLELCRRRADIAQQVK